MIIRNSRKEDLDDIMNIYQSARRFMRDNGNETQWWDGYPPRELIESDIENGVGYVAEDNGEVVAAFAFYQNYSDPTYLNIYNGQWLNNEPYSVIHRIAVKYNGRSIAGECIKYCAERSENLKIDTHKDNIPMQRLLEKCGFKYCGIIYISTGAERIAYQKIC